MRVSERKRMWGVLVAVCAPREVSLFLNALDFALGIFLAKFFPGREVEVGASSFDTLEFGTGKIKVPFRREASYVAR